MNIKKIYNEKREEMKLSIDVQVLDKAVIVTITDSSDTNFISVKNIKSANVAMAYSEAFEEAAQYFLNIEEEQEEKSNGLIDQIMPLPDSGEVMGEEGKKALTAAIVENIPNVIPTPVTPNFSMPEPLANTAASSEMPVIEKSEPMSPVTTCIPEIPTPISTAPEPVSNSVVELNPVPEIHPPVIDAYEPIEVPCNIPVPDMSVVFAPAPNIETTNDQSQPVISYESSNSVQQMVNSQLANVQPIVTDNQGATEIPFGPAFGSKISEMGITNAQWYVKNIPDHSKYLSYREQIRQFYGIQ